MSQQLDSNFTEAYRGFLLFVTLSYLFLRIGMAWRSSKDKDEASVYMHQDQILRPMTPSAFDSSEMELLEDDQEPWQPHPFLFEAPRPITETLPRYEKGSGLPPPYTFVDDSNGLSTGVQDDQDVRVDVHEEFPELHPSTSYPNVSTPSPAY